jgi:hypothetical protein
MMHPYRSRTYSRDRRVVQPESEGSSLVSWIAAAGFAFILFYGFGLPLCEHLLGHGL